jgi:hypothetical protein
MGKRIQPSSTPAKPGNALPKARRKPKPTAKPDHGSTPQPNSGDATTITNNPQGPSDQASA